MKTTVKQLAAGTILSLILLWGNVKAEGTETKASGREAIETELQLEKWMTDESVWNVNSISVAGIEQENEADMQIESWMTSEKTWNFSINFYEVTDSPLEIESWMTSNKIWDGSIQVEPEMALTLENWMKENKVWNR